MTIPTATRRGDHAVVIGGSMTGLLAARVLSDYFERVTIVERDRLPDRPELRSGVPQARHLHILLARGHQILDALFPGLSAELDRAGSPVVELGYDTTFFSRGNWMPRFHSGVYTRSASRALLEWTVRRHLAQHHPVEFLPEHTVSGLAASADRSRITGVIVQPRGGAQDSRTLAADLVLDASGRTSKTPEWLAALGCDAPQETQVNAFLGYSTRWYLKPASYREEWKSIVINSQPPHNRRGAALFEVEGGRWVVTLGGANRDYPPTDEAGFMDFARSLASPALYELLQNAKPCSDISGYQRTDNRIRHYERLTRWPERFAVLGDAACAFNPIYGQGMTVGAMGALLLSDCLRAAPGELDGVGRQFQRRLARMNRTPWLMATGEDFRFPETEGPRPGLAARLTQKYLDRVIALTARDVPTAQAFTHVLNLLQPPTHLFQPEIALKALRLSAPQPRPERAAG